MKNYLKALIVFILVFACAILCVSCGDKGGQGDGTGNGDDNIIEPPAGDEIEDDEETYRIRFVYSYTAKVVNDNGRTENKKDVVTVRSIYIPVDNNGLSAEDKTEIAGLTYHGFSFVKWYAEWDTETQQPVGDEFDFNNAGKISKDITLYGYKGNLAGPEATWRIDYVYAEPDEEEVSATAAETEEPAEGEEETPEVAPEKIGATLYIEGKGRMFDFENGNEIDIGWYKDAGLINKVVISEGITSVGSNSFKNFAKLTDLTLPSTIERIGESAFLGFGVKKITMPANLTVIEKNAFASTPLKEVVLNDGITELKDQAFYGSNKMGSIVIPTSLKSIGNSAFHAGAGNTSHNLSKVFYKGDADAFKKITIAMDNIPLVDRATTYYYTATPENYDTPEYKEIIGNYWHYADDENQLHPVQYCYTLKYLQSASSIPFAQIYLPARPQRDPETDEVITDEDGVPVLKGIVTDDILEQHYNIEYNGYTFAAFKGGKELLKGTEITADQTYNCDRGDIVSVAGGIRFAYASGVLTITKDESTAERVRVSIAVPEYEQKALKNELGEAAADEIARLVEERWAANKADYQKKCDDIMAKAFRIYDFPQATDTGILWTGALSTLKDITTLNIGEGVEYIGNLTFNALTGLKELTLPASLRAVGVEAFSGCSNLVSIYYKGSLTDKANGCPSLTKIEGVRSTVYSLTEEPTGAAGSYWMEKDGARIAWTLDLEKGALTIGGDSVMMNFDEAASAPWYAAKDSIKSVSIAKNINSLGENIVNGYTGVTSINLPIDLRKIPASAFAGTGVVTDTSKYDEDGMLLVNGHLLKVDPAKCNTLLFETGVGTNTIADGAFEGCDAIKRLYVINTIKYINPKAFPNSEIEYIFSDSDEAYWTGTIAVDIDFGKDVSVFYKATRRPTAPALDADGNPTGFTVYVDGKFWYKSGNDYVVWGCMHDWSGWFDTTAPTCATKGIQTRYCLYDKSHVEIQETPMLTEHVLGEFVEQNDATCQAGPNEVASCTQEGCTYTESRPVEGGELGKHNFETYTPDKRTDCTKKATETSICATENCDETHTREIDDSTVFDDHDWGEDNTCSRKGERFDFDCEATK